MENIIFFTPETHGKKLREKIPPKGGGYYFFPNFYPSVLFLQKWK
jgi:hypothetical protein